MKQVFVDTGAWIAIVDENDEYHCSAAEYIKEIYQKNITLISTNYILDETVTWIKYKLGHKKAVKFKKLWDRNVQSGKLTVYWVDKEISSQAWKIFKKYGDHSLSFTDCISFAVCQREEINQIFGFDKDFNILGFLLSPHQVIIIANGVHNIIGVTDKNIFVLNLKRDLVIILQWEYMVSKIGYGIPTVYKIFF